MMLQEGVKVKRARRTRASFGPESDARRKVYAQARTQRHTVENGELVGLIKTSDVLAIYVK